LYLSENKQRLLPLTA